MPRTLSSHFSPLTIKKVFPIFFSLRILRKKIKKSIWFRCRSDLQGIKCYARKDGSDYILNGSKVYISNGWLADVVIVVAVTNREAKSAAHGISLFLLQDKTPGFHKSWLMKKIGLRAFVHNFFNNFIFWSFIFLLYTTIELLWLTYFS